MLKRIKQFFQAHTTKPYSRINFNDMAVEVARRDKGKRETDIAQITEIMGHTLDILAEYAIDNPAGYAERMNERIARVKTRRKLQQHP